MLFAAQRKHLQELNILNRISFAASKSIALKDMLGEVLDEILNLEPLKLEKKGAIFLCDEDKKTPHSRSKCNKSRSDLKRCFVAQAFPGSVVNQ
jgi:hypothetical protein